MRWIKALMTRWVGIGTLAPADVGNQLNECIFEKLFLGYPCCAQIELSKEFSFLVEIGYGCAAQYGSGSQMCW